MHFVWVGINDPRQIHERLLITGDMDRNISCAPIGFHIVVSMDRRICTVNLLGPDVLQFAVMNSPPGVEEPSIGTGYDVPNALVFISNLAPVAGDFQGLQTGG